MPTQWPLNSPSVLHWSLCWKQWEKTPGAAKWPHHSLKPDHRQTAFVSLILSSPGKSLVMKQRLLTYSAVWKNQGSEKLLDLPKIRVDGRTESWAWVPFVTCISGCGSGDISCNYFPRFPQQACSFSGPSPLHHGIFSCLVSLWEASSWICGLFISSFVSVCPSLLHDHQNVLYWSSELLALQGLQSLLQSQSIWVCLSFLLPGLACPLRLLLWEPPNQTQCSTFCLLVC